MLKGALIYLQGLGGSLTTGDWCGAKPHAERLALKHGLPLIPGVWNDADVLLAVDKAREDRNYFIALIGHSHGGAKAREIAERYGAEALDFLGLIDDCPPLNPVAHLLPPRDFPVESRFGVAVWQRNMEPMGIAYNSRQNAACFDVSAQRLGHIDFGTLRSIAGANLVWWRIDYVLGLARAAREYTPPAAPPESPALCAADVCTGIDPPDAPAPPHDGDAGAPATQGGAA